MSPATLLTANSGSSDITLDSLGNKFGTLALTGNNVKVVEGEDTALAASTINGTFQLTTTGNITQTGALAIPNAASTISATGAITLNSANSFSSVALTGTNVAITEADGTDLGTSKVTGALDVISGGAITDSGKLLITGVTTLKAAAGASDIALDSPGNTYGSLALTGAVVTFVEAADTGFGTSKASSLTLTTSGKVTQSSGVITSTGAFTVTATGKDITLGSANKIDGAISLSGGNVTLSNTPTTATDIGVVKATGTLSLTSTGKPLTETAGKITATGVTTLSGSTIALDTVTNSFGTLKITASGNTSIHEDGATDLGLSSITGGTLTIVTTGAVTTSGNVTGPTSTSITATGKPITLSTVGSSYGSIGLNGSSVSIATTGPLVLAASDISGTFSAKTTNADITDSGNLVIAGAATFNAGTADITLNDTHSFGSVAITGGVAKVSESNATVLGTSKVTSLALTNTAGGITQSGALTTTCAVTLTATGLDISLSNSGNSIGGNIVFDGDNVLINNAKAVTLGASTAGTLAVTAKGAITDAGAIVSGATTPTATGFDITLNDGGTQGDLSLNGKNVIVLNTADDISVGASVISGNFTITNTGKAFSFAGATSVAGNLTVIGSGSVSESAKLSLTGTVDITSTGHIDLATTLGKHSFGKLNLSGQIVEVDEAGATDLGNITATKWFTVTSTGIVTDSGTLTVGATSGGTTITTSTKSAVTLDNKTSAYGKAAVGLAVTGGNITLVNNSALVLAATEANGTLSVDAPGITQVGTVTSTGATTLKSTAAAIVLSDTSNSFGTVKITTATNVTLYEAAATDLGESAMTGNLILTSEGAVTDSGKLTVGGTTSITADDGTNKFNIVLDSPTSKLTGAILTLDGASITIANADAAATSLGAITATGSLTVTSASDVNDNAGTAAVIDIGGALSVTAPGKAILLDDAGDVTVDGVVRFSGASANLVNTVDTILGASSLTATSGTALSIDSSDNKILTTSASILTIPGGRWFWMRARVILMSISLAPKSVRRWTSPALP